MSRRPPQKPPSPEKTRRLTEEELRVWEAVTQDDERLDHADIDWDAVLDTLELRAVAPFTEEEKPIIHRPTADQLTKLMAAQQGGFLSAPTPAPVAIAGGGVDHNTIRRLRRGQLPVEAELDLHGMGQEEARLALGHFITASHHRHRRVVRVITGKGRLSPKGSEGGILRRALPKWLSLPPCEGLVLHHVAALQADGGEGAFYVLLRRSRNVGL